MQETSVHQVIDQLARAFTIKDIMVPTSALIRGQDAQEAAMLLSRHPDFDVIPTPLDGLITGYVHRRSGKPKVVTAQDLISDGTTLLDLPDLFLERDFFFVLASNTIAGFVHFSDLNNSIIKLPFFALFEAVERRLWKLIQNQITEKDVEIVMSDKERMSTILKKREKAKKKDVDLGWSGILYFDEIIRLAVHYKICQVASNEREVLTSIRNKVAHTDKLLVSQHNDTRKLTQVRDLCYDIVNLRDL